MEFYLPRVETSGGVLMCPVRAGDPASAGVSQCVLVKPSTSQYVLYMGKVRQPGVIEIFSFDRINFMSKRIRFFIFF